MKILALDPGPHETGIVGYDTANFQCPIIEKHDMDNDVLLYKIGNGDFNQYDKMAVELMSGSYGQPVADETFRTVMWSGRIVQQWIRTGKPMPQALWRATIKGHLAHSAKANDKLVNAALRVRFDEPLSPKHTKGKLKGISKHTFAALAVAVTSGDGIKSIKDGVEITFGSREC